MNISYRKNKTIKTGEDVLSWKTCIWSYCHVFGQ